MFLCSVVQVAIRQDGLQVLHVVLYPRYKYDLPILAMDLVIAKDRVSLVVVDACPVSQNKTLPSHYLQVLQNFGIWSTVK
jgi:phycocyanobilin:ferredoxin oxidoreductase